MKTSRIPKEAAERTSFGLFAIIQSRRVVLPLKGVECDFSVVSGIAEVSMTQIFRQDNPKPLDCEYLFPLPSDASVFSCEADINGRVIRAQVRERQEARQIAAEKKAAGYRTALVESERDNLFTLSLGNVQPDDLVIVRLKYFQTVRSLAETRAVEIPFCPGIRYIPGNPLVRMNRGKGVVDDTDQVPDASRISPPRIDDSHPDAAFVDVRGTLDGKFVTENSLGSPSHPIVVRGGDELRVALSDKADVPDRDFVLRWTERDAETVAPRAWVREKGGETYALLEVRAPRNAPAERAPGDFYFLVDRSGSMQGEKWDKAAEALVSCMKVLGSSDRAMVTFFETGFKDFAERPLPVAELLEDRQFLTIKRLGTGGGTEMSSALEHVLGVAARHSRGRDQNLILITDAQIGNESAILELMKTAPGLAVHCFGIDVALNDSLLLALSRQQGGTFHSLNPNDDIQAAVTALGKTLGQPVLLDLQLSEGWELADRRIPNLYAGQIQYVSARSTNGKALELTARTPSSEPWRVQFEKQSAAGEAPYLHWCRSRIQRWIAEGKDHEAVALSTQSNLICTLTAFVAWDEAEKVTVANHLLVQPAMALAGGDALLCELVADAPVAAFSKQSRSPAGSGLLDKLFKFSMKDEPERAYDGGLAQDAGPKYELSLRRELSDLCHQAGVVDWKPLVEAIFKWIAEASAEERPRRIAAVNDLVREIKAHVERMEQLHAQARQAREDLRQMLWVFAEKASVGK